MRRSIATRSPRSPTTSTLREFYKCPAERWSHLRIANPIESTFATVGLRTKGWLAPDWVGHRLQAHRLRLGPVAIRQRARPGRPRSRRRHLPQRRTARTTHRLHAHRTAGINRKRSSPEIPHPPGLDHCCAAGCGRVWHVHTSMSQLHSPHAWHAISPQSARGTGASAVVNRCGNALGALGITAT
jgi:hypothetical protein